MNVVSATDIPCTTGMTAAHPVPARSAYPDVAPFAQWLEHAAKTLVFLQGRDPRCVRLPGGFRHRVFVNSAKTEPMVSVIFYTS